MTTAQNLEDIPIIPICEIVRFITECFVAAGTPREVARAQAILLSEADKRGYLSHGLNRLEMYILAIKEGNYNPKGLPEILKEGPTTAWVDGHNGLGAKTGMFCMELAIKKAKSTGIGWVSCKNCNHNGIQALYCSMAIKEGLVGLVFTNTPAILQPTRAKGTALGTNPIGFGAPAKGKDSFILDIATTAVSLEKIEILKLRYDPLPPVWAADEDGMPTTDPDVALKAKCLLPLGGTEETGGCKGTGLAIMVETLCGISAGSFFGPFIQMVDAVWNLGQCYIAMDPKRFAPNFEERMSTLLDYIRNMHPRDPSKPVYVPGDYERNNMSEVEELGGIKYIPTVLEASSKLAANLGVDPLKDIDGNPATYSGKSVREKPCVPDCGVKK